MSNSLWGNLENFAVLDELILLPLKSKYDDHKVISLFLKALDRLYEQKLIIKINLMDHAIEPQAYFHLFYLRSFSLQGSDDFQLNEKMLKSGLNHVEHLRLSCFCASSADYDTKILEGFKNLSSVEFKISDDEDDNDFSGLELILKNNNIRKLKIFNERPKKITMNMAAVLENCNVTHLILDGVTHCSDSGIIEKLAKASFWNNLEILELDSTTPNFLLDLLSQIEMPCLLKLTVNFRINNFIRVNNIGKSYVLKTFPSVKELQIITDCGCTFKDLISTNSLLQHFPNTLSLSFESNKHCNRCSLRTPLSRATKKLRTIVYNLTCFEEIKYLLEDASKLPFLTNLTTGNATDKDQLTLNLSLATVYVFPNLEKLDTSYINFCNADIQTPHLRVLNLDFGDKIYGIFERFKNTNLKEINFSSMKEGLLQWFLSMNFFEPFPNLNSCTFSTVVIQVKSKEVGIVTQSVIDSLVQLRIDYKANFNPFGKYDLKASCLSSFPHLQVYNDKLRK